MKKLSCIAMMLVTLTAKAGIMTIEPDDYAVGTRVGTPEASISYLDHRRGDDYFTYRAAFAATDPTCLVYTTRCAAPTGTRVLSDGTLLDGQLQPRGTGELSNIYRGLQPDAIGTRLDGEIIANMWDFYALQIDLSAPTNFLSVDFVGPSSDPALLFAFATDGSFLSLTRGSTTRIFMEPCAFETACYRWQQTVDVTHEFADIAFVIVGSTSSVTFPDAIRFEVPAPQSAALFAIGLFLLARNHRKRTAVRPACAGRS